MPPLSYSCKEGRVMISKTKRLPKNYDGMMPTSRQIKHLLPHVLTEICSKLEENPSQIATIWREIVGEQIARLTQVIQLDAGLLKVKVENSTLYSLLVEHEKHRLLKTLQKRLPKLKIQNILFRIG